MLKLKFYPKLISSNLIRTLKLTKPAALVLSIFCVIFMIDNKQTSNPDSKQKLSDSPTTIFRLNSYGKIPLFFEPNQGQTENQVKFLSHGRGFNLFLTANKAILTLKKSSGNNKTPKSNKESYETKTLQLRFVGSNPNPEINGINKLPGKSNYILGNDPAGWRTNIPNYAKVSYSDIYPGIDLVYYGNRAQLEYDFVVKPGADPDAIIMDWEGVEKLSIDDSGNLILLENGGVLTLKAPIIYQRINGRKLPISGGYILNNHHEVGFEIGIYETDLPLIIDPVLSYSTYLGGSNSDEGAGIAVDAQGNAYIAGTTNSVDFPTANPGQGGPQGGSGDVFVLKLDPEGSAIIYSTFIGGGSFDKTMDLAVDDQGIAYVMGVTGSDNFPTVSAAQGTLAVNILGNGQDAFVSKLNAAGSGLIFSTYLGGTSTELAGDGGIAVDAQGNAYITGDTGSRDFPLANAFQPTFSGGSEVFISKFSSGGGLSYSSYYGGAGFDGGYDIAVDAGGNAYVTGKFNDFLDDFLVLKVNADGSLGNVIRLAAGGSGVGTGIAVDSLGNIYITGTTSSHSFPTVRAFQGTIGGFNDAFVTKLSPGFFFIYSTYLGGSDEDNFSDVGSLDGDIAVDNEGNAYVTGSTGSADFPTTDDAMQTVFGGTYNPDLPIGDVFVTKLDPSGTNLTFSTYLGGSDDEKGVE